MTVEALQQRWLLSISVAQGYPGYYEVYGDETAQVIAVSVSAADSTFTLDGVKYEGVAHLSVFASGGDDIVSVAIDGPSSIAASIDAGLGNDDVTLTGGGGVWGRAGNDTLRITESYRGEVYGGQGDDVIVINGACADAEIQGGSGSDLIDASNSAYGIYASSGSGDDTVVGSHYDDQLYGDSGNDLLIGNGGDDTFYSVDMECDRLIGGAGVDVAYADMGEAGVWGVEYVYYV